MEAVALANIIGQLILQGITVYKELAAQNANVPPLATILAQADADWTTVETTANAQLNPPPAAG